MKIPEGENYQKLLRRRVGELKLSKTLYRPGNWNARHRHDNARFVFVLRGDFLEKYEGKERFCRPFTTIFRPPLEAHSEIYRSGVVCLSVDLDPAWLKKLEDYSLRLERSQDFRNQNLDRLIDLICQEIALNDEASSLAIDALLTEVAVEMHRGTGGFRGERSPLWLRKTIEYIDQNFLSNLTLRELAGVADVHPVHLSRVFKNAKKCTIAEYIRRLRVERARRLLTESDLPLAMVAVESGFADQSHFTKTFKRLTRQTPAQFRKTSR